MILTRSRISSGVVMVLVLFGIATSAWGQAPGGGVAGAFGGETRGITRLAGSVVCTNCSLDEVRRVRAGGRLFELRHAMGRVVMSVHWVDDAARWESIAGLSHQLWTRTADSVFRQLMAEENLLREVEVTGLLRSDRTLDISSVAVIG